MTLAPALPGITFEVVPRPLDEALPRMDVCGFVGFADRGPIDVAVAVEDSIEFRRVFGADPVLARSDEGDDVRAHLGAAVEAFFANGGVRAWVVRVADSSDGAALTNRFCVPGVLVPGEADRIDGWRLLTLAARSPGAWSDAMSAGATLQVNSVVARVGDAVDSMIVDHGVDVVVGDLVRVLFGDGRSLRVIATSVDPHADGRAVGFRPTAGWLIYDRPPLPPFGAGFRLGPDLAVELPSVAVDVDSDAEVTVWVDDTDQLAAGDLIVFPPDLAGDPSVIVSIGDEVADADEMGAGDVSGFGGRRFAVEQAWAVTPGTATWLESFSVPPTELVVEIERLRLTVRDGESQMAELDSMGLGSIHPRPVVGLPGDDLVYPMLAGTRRRQISSDTSYTSPTTPSSPKGDAADRSLTPFELEASSPRFPLAGAGEVSLLLALGVSTDPTAVRFGAPPAEIGVAAREVRNGLEQFGAELFVDPALADLGADTILAAAWDVSSVRARRRRLRGIHALVTNDDVTLVCVPDAVHTGWDRIRITLPEPLAAPMLSVHDVAADEATVGWTPVAGATGYELDHDADPAWTQAERIEVGDPDTVTTNLAIRPGCQHYEYVRVKARRGGERGPWSNTVGVLVPIAGFTQCDGMVLDVTPAEPAAPVTRPRELVRYRRPTEAAPWIDLRAIHSATLRACAGRGDVLAVLGLPGGFTADDATRHVSVLTGAASAAAVLAAGVRPLTNDERGVLGYGALYHPWPAVGSASEPVRSIPPDGAVAGTYAARSIDRGAWIAPARMALDSVLALTPAIDPARHLAMTATGVNPVADDPSGFMALTQLTLSDEAATQPVNVRRLTMLLRRLARRVGDGLVFEPNDRELQRLVQIRLERLLLGLFRRGAFAGATPAEAFEVSTGDNVNPPESVERGRFIAEVRFAPARPLEFITVRLVLAGAPSGEGRA